MGPRTGRWTDQQYEAFADDALVIALGTEAQPVPLPEVLRSSDTEPHSSEVWVDMLSLVHHIHRGTVVRAWWRCHEQPGEVVECDVLADVGDFEHLRRQ